MRRKQQQELQRRRSGLCEEQLSDDRANDLLKWRGSAAARCSERRRVGAGSDGAEETTTRRVKGDTRVRLAMEDGCVAPRSERSRSFGLASSAVGVQMVSIVTGKPKT